MPYKPCVGLPDPNILFEPDGADKDWLDAVVDTFGVVPRENGYVFAGVCPRCCHQIDEPIDIAYGYADSVVPLTLACNCGAHKSTIDTLPGCGRFGNFDVPRPA